jgi:hypothetical protein
LEETLEATVAAESPVEIFSAVNMTRALVALALVAQVAVAWRYWNLTWDDAAITLGFARTFAFTGRIEPTPGSGIVEGYSTTLWMLLMAAAARLVSSPAALLAFAKICTLLLNLANVLLIRQWLRAWTPETVANLVAGTMGCELMLYETINGMETPLMLTLILLMLLLRSQPGRAAYAGYVLLGSAFVLTRWEAAWLLVPFVLVERTGRRAVVSSAAWLSVFVVSNLVRWRYFGSVIPNTIIAKRGPPYTDPHLGIGRQILTHLSAAGSILGYCEVMLVILFGSFVGSYLLEHTPVTKLLQAALRASWQLRFCFLFLAFSLLLTVGIGPNWGPPARAFYCGWCFLFCLLLLPVLSDRNCRPWIPAALCLIAVVQLASRIREMNSAFVPAYMPGATVARVALVSDALAEVQSASGRESLVFAGPDMGGVLLYSKGVRVVDLGMLCDPVLARRSYRIETSYVLDQRKPDAIEIHKEWDTISIFDTSPVFFARYRPVYVDGIRMFLTRALIAEIDPSRLTEQAFDSDGRPDSGSLPPPDQYGAKYDGNDYALNRNFGTYLVLH